MLSEANKLVSDNQNANFCYADVNCRLEIRWNDNQGDFFGTLEDLRDLLELLGFFIKFLYIICSYLHLCSASSISFLVRLKACSMLRMNLFVSFYRGFRPSCSAAALRDSFKRHTWFCRIPLYYCFP